MNFRVVDDQGRQLGMGRSLVELKRELGEGTEQILQEQFPDEKHTGWTMGELSELMELERGGQTLVGYPALVDDGDAVTLQVFDSPEKAREIHRAGVRRLLAIAFRDRIRGLEKTLARDVALGPLQAHVGTAALGRTVLPGSRPMRPAGLRPRAPGRP